MNKPNLKNYRWIVVNSSGGKDSQTALRVIVQECDRLGVSRDRIVVSHQCLGRMEWQGTLDLVKAQADHYGLRLEVSKYRNKAGQELTLLDAVRNRGMWPSSQNRYCTSDFKRDPGARVIRKLFRESPGSVLNVKGFRAEESSARAKAMVFGRNERLCTESRLVHDFLPIHEWAESAVWASVKASGVPYHQAYDLGMPRLSCCFCIFAPKNALLIAGRANPELLNDYVQVERAIGHTFQHGKPIAAIQEAIAAGEQPTAVHGKWNM
jgi:3'-phosphoadenosine 5'-phosphosulfate sulfotransferase (PAPS reductase)/FAD synthetase